jgi:hypothetical protein
MRREVAGHENTIQGIEQGAGIEKGDEEAEVALDHRKQFDSLTDLQGIQSKMSDTCTFSADADQIPFGSPLRVKFSVFHKSFGLFIKVSVFYKRKPGILSQLRGI